MRSRGTCLAVLLATAIGASPAVAVLVDTLVADVDGTTVAASDVALSRALGLFSLEPSSMPITREDVERLVEARLLVAEARRLGLVVEPESLERRWQATAVGTGGEVALDGWLAEVGIERSWARRLLEEDLLGQELFNIRFRAFAVVTEGDIDAAASPPPQDLDVRERIRQRLATQSAEEALAKWIESARQRARIRILVPESRTVDLPFPMPAAASRARPGS